ncbi:hypothetical protein BDV27DRAFT_18268 [Aspergillus caelatus]|uniref:Uncharacterized protein n=1 Tax=Aspergillus caelatus TaxID=61420 RepID=A0A5N6ZZQ0_9EURO|nr:uncharacterized protein BDV27DRAFT_18268 [Aspergillus caelatus]KAE8362409.1 hypothetical protein BDV27DRAFT_18268 [Aspergillus caelatus]
MMLFPLNSPTRTVSHVPRRVGCGFDVHIHSIVGYSSGSAREFFNSGVMFLHRWSIANTRFCHSLYNGGATRDGAIRATSTGLSTRHFSVALRCASLQSSSWLFFQSEGQSYRDWATRPRFGKLQSTAQKVITTRSMSHDSAGKSQTTDSRHGKRHRQQ